MINKVLFTPVLVLIVLIVLGTITSCGDSNSSSSGETTPVITENDLSNLTVYDTSGKFANVLYECVQTNSSCTLANLPFIAQENSNIDSNLISKRVLVSHNWMGIRFKQILDALPKKTLQLFGSVTAIVIHSEIRPSFYWSKTGAIYIDPDYLWLTLSEKNDISKKADYRTNYGKSLATRFLWRYVKDNKYAYKYYSLNDNSERTLGDITLPVFRLLFHELAHANDIAPRDKLYLLDKNEKIQNVLNSTSFIEQHVSHRLYNSGYKLFSQELLDLAKVLYGGTNATSHQKQMQPDYAGSLFASDNANNMYSYYTLYEDVAMIFEAILMKYFFDVEMDIAFSNNPSGSNLTCSDYIVGWGSRNRISSALLKTRANYMMNLLFISDINWNVFLDTEVGNEKPMRQGVDWCINLNLDSDSISNKQYMPYNSHSIKRVHIKEMLPP